MWKNLRGDETTGYCEKLFSCVESCTYMISITLGQRVPIHSVEGSSLWFKKVILIVRVKFSGKLM